MGLDSKSSMKYKGTSFLPPAEGVNQFAPRSQDSDSPDYNHNQTSSRIDEATSKVTELPPLTGRRQTSSNPTTPLNLNPNDVFVPPRATSTTGSRHSGSLVTPREKKPRRISIDSPPVNRLNSRGSRPSPQSAESSSSQQEPLRRRYRSLSRARPSIPHSTSLGISRSRTWVQQCATVSSRQQSMSSLQNGQQGRTTQPSVDSEDRRSRRISEMPAREAAPRNGFQRSHSSMELKDAATPRTSNSRMSRNLSQSSLKQQPQHSRPGRTLKHAQSDHVISRTRGAQVQQQQPLTRERLTANGSSQAQFEIGGDDDDDDDEDHTHIHHWLRGVQEAEAPPLDEDYDYEDPKQTDTAIHIVYKGD